MKILLALAKRAAATLAIVMLAPPLCAQTMHSGERTDDFTGIRRNMSRIDPAPCGLNQAPVGSTCVNIAVAPPQPTCEAGFVFSGGGCVAMPIQESVRPWTAYFLGQNRCAAYNLGYICAYINASGELTVIQNPNYNWSGSQTTTKLPMPNINESFAFTINFSTDSNCRFGNPIFTGWMVQSAKISPIGITVVNNTPNDWGWNIWDTATRIYRCG